MKIFNRNNEKKVQSDLIVQLKIACIRKDRLIRDVLSWLYEDTSFSSAKFRLFDKVCEELEKDEFC